VEKLLIELNGLYSSRYCLGDKIEKNDMGGACSTYGERRGVYRVLVGNLEGKETIWKT
jgi:hypothetical protein